MYLFYFRADVTRDGYLDCEELKAFMEYRNAPITHCEAKRLLKAVDPEYEGFINLDQASIPLTFSLLFYLFFI